LYRRLLVVAAVGQAVSSALVSVFGGAFTTADRAGEPLIVPPGGAFIIWNVIIALSIGYAIWAESDQRPNLALRNRLTGRFWSPASASRSGLRPRSWSLSGLPW
jgi:hypothetical protein